MNIIGSTTPHPARGQQQKQQRLHFTDAPVQDAWAGPGPIGRDHEWTIGRDGFEIGFHYRVPIGPPIAVYRRHARTSIMGLPEW